MDGKRNKRTVVEDSDEDETTDKKRNASSSDAGEHEDEVAGVIRVKIEALSIKKGFEVLSKIGKTCFFRFTRNWFTIAASSEQQSKRAKKLNNPSTVQKCQAEFRFEWSDIPRYTYTVTQDKGELQPVYETSAISSTFLSQIKNIKQGCCSFCIRVKPGCKSDKGIEMNIQGSSGTKYIPTKKVNSSNSYPYADHFSRWYNGVDPCGRFLPYIFQSTATAAKNTGCDEIECRFHPRTKNFTLVCWDSTSRNKTALHAESLDSGASNSEYDYDEPGDTIVARFIMIKQNDWIHKLSNLSSTILKVYMRPDDEKAPLIIRTCVGGQGSATFYIPNIVR